MMRRFRLVHPGVWAGLLLVLGWSTVQGGWSVGVSVGVPLCHRPYRPPCHYRPYVAPVYYVRPAPVYVQPVTVLEPVPVVAPSRYAPAVPAAPTEPAPAPVLPAPGSSRPATEVGYHGSDADRYLRQLQHPDPRERSEAVVQLGRIQAAGALPALTAALTNDRSPMVREAAARGLGLFGAAESLDTLQRAAQADEDRDVRRSASYAADVIRSNLARR